MPGYAGSMRREGSGVDCIRHVIASRALVVGAPSLVIAGISRRAMQREGR